MKAKDNRAILFVVLVCFVFTTGCTSSGALSQSTRVSEALPGYLPVKDLPDSLALLPAPPAAGSAALALDEEVNRKSLALRGTPRWALAVEDANLEFPEAAGTFSCALNVPITEQDTPHLYKLLRRTVNDASGSTQRAKDKYKRLRPFLLNKEPTCTPEKESTLAATGSYPSGHAAIGWAWALILSEILPAQTNAILARGWAFGDSRLVCNVHWQSDVSGGRVMGASTVARLHADRAFREDIEAARVELEAVGAKGLKPQRDCAAEAAALSR